MCCCEPTLDELLDDPMMEIVLRHSRTSAHELRELLSAIASRLAGSGTASPAASPTAAD